jgi:hypothetical protein
MSAEDQIRRAIRREVEASLGDSPDRLPRDVRSRLRRRQATSVALAGVMAAALAVGAIGVTRMVTNEPQTRPGEQPTLNRPEKRATLASGVFRGASWELRVTYNDEAGWCLVITRGPGTSRYCSFTGEKPLEIRPGLGFVFGTVTKRAASVRAKDVDYHRPVDVRILEIPHGLDAPFNIIFAIPRSNAGMKVKAIDQRGETIQTESLP